MRRLFAVFFACVTVLSSCSSNDSRRTRYPASQSNAMLPMPTQPSAIAATAPGTSPWPPLCLPAGATLTLPGVDLAPFASALGVKPCDAPADGEASERAALLPLPVIGFGPAVVSVPIGTLRPRPVVVALHGSASRPEWQCEEMRAFVQNRAFVLCPRGVERGDSKGDDPRFSYGGGTEAEVDAGIDALRIVYGPLVDPGPMLYAGFSLGAILAPGIVMRDATRFPRMLLIEGGTSGWDEHKYARDGGQRVLWACGQAGCAATATALAARFVKQSVPAKVAYAPGAGHTSGGAVAEAIHRDFDWLVEGDPRWAR